VTPDYCWVDGHITPWARSAVHVSAEAVLRGASVFEGIRAYRGEDGLQLFRLDDHLRRLFDTSLRFLHLNSPCSADELAAAIVATIEANDQQADVYVRLVVYVGELNVGHELEADTGAFIISDESPVPAKPGLRVTLSPWRRVGDLMMPARVKASANYLNSRIATTDAQRKGFDSAILLNERGKVSEGPAMNVFLVRDGRLATPRLSDGILEGVTRSTILHLANEASLPVEEREIDPAELYLADELFFCGTAYEVVPVVDVDGNPVGDGNRGPVTARLQQDYFHLVRGALAAPAGWLTPVRSLARR
jgi:branched-chain amino acid aminotransferase